MKKKALKAVSIAQMKVAVKVLRYFEQLFIDDIDRWASLRGARQIIDRTIAYEEGVAQAKKEIEGRG